MTSYFRRLAAIIALIVASVVGLGGIATACSVAAPPAPAATSEIASAKPPKTIPWIEVSALPREAQQLLPVIDKGGPFEYAKDGTTFRNAERILPQKQAGYYREYTVKTPGASNRGARRIITGKGGEFYYTGDHYRTFSRIRR